MLLAEAGCTDEIPQVRKRKIRIYSTHRNDWPVSGIAHMSPTSTHAYYSGQSFLRDI